MSIQKTYFVPHPPLIIPEIGKGQEKKISDTIEAYNKIAKAISEIKPDTINISTPHSTCYADYFHISSGEKAEGDFAQFRTPQIHIDVAYDQDLIKKIEEYGLTHNFSVGTSREKNGALDHATMIPLYFINKFYSNYKIVRISPSGLPLIDHYNIGKIINSLIDQNQKVIWVASGDLSHVLKEDGPYGFVKEGPEFDEKIKKIIISKDIDSLLKMKSKFYQKAGQCGLGSLAMMLGVFDGYHIESELLSYEGPFGVGYAVASFRRISFDKSRYFSSNFDYEEDNEIIEIKKQEDEYIKLARQSLEYYLKNKKVMPIPNHTGKELLEKIAGVFVSIHKDNALRGCIGTLRPTTSCVAEEIIQNAISSGTRDYRFPPIKEDELNKLHFSVDVLFPPEPIHSMDELDVKRYGVIVKSGYKTGLLLPNLDDVDNVEYQVEIALRKAGITNEETYRMERFEVIRHE